MSRQQWGHGFYRGLEAAKQEHVQYCVTYDDHGHIEQIFIVQDIHDDIYVLEAISYMWFVANGLVRPSNEPIEYENIYELKANELKNPKWFYRWESVAKAFMEDEKKWKKEFYENV